MNFNIRIATTFVFSLCFALFTAAAAWAEPNGPLPLPGIGIVQVTSSSKVSFDVPDAWENYLNSNGAELSVENGIYRAYTPNPGYLWGLNTQEHTDVVEEVEITPLTIFQDVGGGIMCRADFRNNGDGYYFMISPNGSYSIQIGRGTGLTPLVDWSRSKAVHSGIDRNTIRAVCVNNQLAMYVNDQLVASITDDTYASGYAGLAIASGDNSADMAFDNVMLYTVEMPAFISASGHPSDPAS